MLYNEYHPNGNGEYILSNFFKLPQEFFTFLREVLEKQTFIEKNQTPECRMMFLQLLFLSIMQMNKKEPSTEDERKDRELILKYLKNAAAQVL